MHESARPNVLLVEDDYLIATALKVHLEHQGAHVVGPVAHVSAALDLIERGERIDCAMLDVKVGDGPVFPVADALLVRGVRVAFMTCYDRAVIPQAYKDVTFFNKMEDPKVLYRWVSGA